MIKEIKFVIENKRSKIYKNNKSCCKKNQRELFEILDKFQKNLKVPWDFY